MASVLPRSLRASSSAVASTSRIACAARQFGSTSARLSEGAAPATDGAAAVTAAEADIKPKKKDPLEPFMKYEEFKFDDITSMGYRRLIEIDTYRSLIAKVHTDKKALNAQAKPFKVPKGQLRVTTIIDLSVPDSEYNNKNVLVAPVSSLPLKTPAAINRFKVLAGPRWTPGFPGRGELGPNAAGKYAELHAADANGANGYVKISEERFPERRMNRKSASDMLERLVDAANDAKSPLPADTPVDMRHLLARQAKKKNRAQNVWARAEAMRRRPEVVGGVRGFPKEWLAPQ